MSCQRNKRKSKKYGHLPEEEAEALPWDKICIDLIGPYTIQRKGQKDLICKCVTMIDPATGWFEIHPYDDKSVGGLLKVNLTNCEPITLSTLLRF